MVIETRSPEETFAVGKSLGEKAFPGQVLTLTGDLGKRSLLRDSQKDLGLKNR